MFFGLLIMIEVGPQRQRPEQHPAGDGGLSLPGAGGHHEQETSPMGQNRTPLAKE